MPSPLDLCPSTSPAGEDCIPRLPAFLEQFMLPSADKLYGNADLIFQQDLTPAHTARSTNTWLNGHRITVLDWPANLAYLTP